MREILFRGKRSHDGEWIIGSLLTDERGEKHIIENSAIIEDGHHLRIDSDTPVFFDQETVGQFTGLTGKDGTKIFEGDVLFFDPFESHINDRTVKFENGAFKAELIRSRYSIPMCEVSTNIYYRVIGNVHDNPELLEDTQCKP